MEARIVRNDANLDELDWWPAMDHEVEVQTSDLMDYFNIEEESSTTVSVGPEGQVQEVAEMSNTMGNSVGLPSKMPIFTCTVGRFPCTYKMGLGKCEFVVAKYYVYFVGLKKGRKRFLHCTFPDCKAKAMQAILENRQIENFIDVTTPHNIHIAPWPDIQKLHMAFYVLRRHYRYRKNASVAKLYQKMCKEDPSLKLVMNLEIAIDELRRYRSSYKKPELGTFEEIYERIEDVEFHQLHFTKNNRQFYQERFSSDDGSLAILFSSNNIIKKTSDSMLMFIDASFMVNSEDTFKYHLVTVLVFSVNDYYPIAFALVNKKSEDLFKKVFTHLHNVVAPKLRPAEIVTEYSRSLRNSLRAVYRDSSISSSQLYYVQNLYKKTCSMNMAGNLKRDPRFRHVFNILSVLPLVPIDVIPDAFVSILFKSKYIKHFARPLFNYVKRKWLGFMTRQEFCVHDQEHRLNAEVVATFDKLRKIFPLTQDNGTRQPKDISGVIDKLRYFESKMYRTYKSMECLMTDSIEDDSVLDAWMALDETNQKYNIYTLYKMIPKYIKIMQRHLKIWGCEHASAVRDDLIEREKDEDSSTSVE